MISIFMPTICHPLLGNNAQFAKLLGIKNILPLEQNNPQTVVMQGRYEEATTPTELKDLLNNKLCRAPLHEPADKTKIKTVAWFTGGGQGYIQLAAEKAIDAYITDVVSEQTITPQWK